MRLLKNFGPVSTVTMYEPGGIAVGSSATMSDGVAPKVIATNPPNGALGVDPSLSEISVTFEETLFGGSGFFLLGAVLDRFFAKYVSINSFTETVVNTVGQGEVMRWPMRTGRRATI